MVRKDSDEYAQRNPEADNAITGEFVVANYANLCERLQTSNLLMFGLNTVRPQNFAFKLPYCYEVNISAIPRDVEIPPELLKDAIDYAFVREAKVVNLVSAFFEQDNINDEGF